jgi:hypothetical protein
VAALCAPAERPVIAEVLYDPAGDDTGNEFVELYSSASAPVSLAGLRLEAGDGSGPGRWTLRWTGGTGDTLRRGERFLIGGAKLVPAPDAIITLDLQNGPDAVRLVWPHGAIEVLGWGALEFGEYFCGEAAADVASGFSLARVPDDAGTGSNATDFRAASPSPGRANQTRRNAAVVAGSLALDPEQPEVGAPALVRARIHNAGRDPIEAGAVTCIAFRDDFEIGTAAAAALAAGETLAVQISTVAAPEGRFELRLVLSMAGDEAAADDTLRAPARFGPGSLEITEIQFHPASGEGEWVEVRNRSGVALDLGGFTLADRADRGGALLTATVLMPESLAVLAQDRASLLATFPSLDTARVIAVQSWSALNNSDDDAGIADVVRLRERDGVPVARVEYSAAGLPAGFTRELAGGGFWTASSFAGGSPLAPPPVRPPLESALEIVPRRLRAGMPARIEWSIPWPARASVTIYDLEGARVTEAFTELSVTPRGERSWDARLPPGLYVAVLSAKPAGATVPLTATRAFRVEGTR